MLDATARGNSNIKKIIVRTLGVVSLLDFEVLFSPRIKFVEQDFMNDDHSSQNVRLAKSALCSKLGLSKFTKVNRYYKEFSYKLPYHEKELLSDKVCIVGIVICVASPRSDQDQMSRPAVSRKNHLRPDSPNTKLVDHYLILT